VSEGFNLSKLLSSPFTGLYWVKCTVFGLGIGMILFVAVGMWKAYFRRPDPTTTQRAETIENHYNTPKATFGCASTKTYIKYPVNALK